MLPRKLMLAEPAAAAAPAFSRETQFSPDPYLELMKRVLTRAVLAKDMERHTIRPRGLRSRLLQRFNAAAAGYGLELVRLTATTAQDYLESGHEATNRAEDAETMLGTRQLDHMERCIADVVRRGVPGDLIEAGVWRGGMTIFMRAALAAYGCADRNVWVADSFAGLPEIDRRVDGFSWGSQRAAGSWQPGDMAVSLETVRRNFARYGLLDDQVIFLEGFFADSLPVAPIGRLSILRVDADLYQSTADVLHHLYPALSPGGYAIFDDYQNLPDCRRAIDEFREERGVNEPIERIDQRAVYWRKRV